MYRSKLYKLIGVNSNMIGVNSNTIGVNSNMIGVSSNMIAATMVQTDGQLDKNLTVHLRFSRNE